jgi:hypothetical protein
MLYWENKESNFVGYGKSPLKDSNRTRYQVRTLLLPLCVWIIDIKLPESHREGHVRFVLTKRGRDTSGHPQVYMACLLKWCSGHMSLVFWNKNG